MNTFIVLQNLRFFISLNNFSCSGVLSTKASESQVWFTSFKRFCSSAFCFVLVLTGVLFLIFGCLEGALPSNSLPLTSTRYEIRGNEEELLDNFTKELYHYFLV